MQTQEQDVRSMSPQLQIYLERYEAIKADAKALVADLDEAAFNWKPGPERWSVGECLDHLNVTGTLLLPKLDAAIERGRARNVVGEGPFQYGWLGRWWIESMHATGRKVKTPKAFTPSSSTLHKDEVLAAFLTLQDALMQRILASDGLDLRRIKASSGATNLLRMPVGVWFESTVAHEQRHLGQARRIIAHPDFPSNA